MSLARCALNERDDSLPFENGSSAHVEEVLAFVQDALANHGPYGGHRRICFQIHAKANNTLIHHMIFR
jgi:hypothetical protein